MSGEALEPQPLRKHVLWGVILAAFLMFLPLIPYLRLLGFSAGDETIRFTSFFISRLLFWLTLLLVFLYAKKIERQDMLPWKDQTYSFWMYLAFFFMTLVTLIILLSAVTLIMKLAGIYTTSDKVEQIRETFRNNPSFGIFTCVTAGVAEEFIFRGYMLPRLEFLLKNRFFSILVSTVIFGLLHFGYGTLLNMIGPFVIGAVFALHYSYFRSLKFLVFFHTFWDLLAVFMPHK